MEYFYFQIHQASTFLTFLTWTSLEYFSFIFGSITDLVGLITCSIIHYGISDGIFVMNKISQNITDNIFVYKWLAEFRYDGLVTAFYDRKIWSEISDKIINRICR